PRFARVVDRVALGQNLRRLAFEVLERLVQRTESDAAELHRIELLEAVQRARRYGIADVRDGAERHELTIRSGDMHVLELLGVHALDAQELRDDLVAAAGDAEAVDVIAADRGAEVLAHRL